VSATLGTIETAAARAAIRAPAVLIAGDVTSHRRLIGGWDTRPLSGVRVLVTRAREQSSALASTLRQQGADVIEAPAIAIDDAAPASVERAIRKTAGERYEWIVFTSANGARVFGDALVRAGLDARALGPTKVAAIGPGTADTLAALGVQADLVPRTHTTAALARAFPRGSGCVLLARAAGLDRALDDALAAKGWRPERASMYRVRQRRMPPSVRRAIAGGDIDVITFASAGTVAAFHRSFSEALPRPTKVVCIGPVTARAARAAGLRVSRVAHPHTIPGLVDAVVATASRHPHVGR
jgi:uroporphyrinogen III methyltransferase/synthase